MNEKYKLNFNSQLTVMKDENNKIKIFPKKNFLNPENLILEQKEEDILYLEELSLPKENNIKLLIFNKNSNSSQPKYEMQFLKISFDYFPQVISKVIPTKKVPIILTNFYYQYVNEKNQICLINKNAEIIEIEKIIEECCSIHDIELKNIELKKDLSVADNFILTLQVENIEIRFCLKLGNKLEVENGFFSDIDGYHRLLSQESDTKYLDFQQIFFTRLKYHPIMNFIYIRKKCDLEREFHHKVLKKKIEYKKKRKTSRA